MTDDAGQDAVDEEQVGDGTETAETGFEGFETPSDDGPSAATTDEDSAAAGDEVEPGGTDESAEATEELPLADQVAEYDENLGRDVQELEERATVLEEHVSELEAELEEARGQVSKLETELEEARDEVDEFESRLKRKQADFENYKKRAKKRQQQIRERATEDFVERLTEVRDNLVRALEQDADANIRPGVESTLEEFDRVLAEEGVDPIEPSPGDAVDPERHEVMMRVDSDRPAETIAEVYKPGYEMAGQTIEPAQVTVSDGPATGTEEDPVADDRSDSAGEDDAGDEDPTDTEGERSDSSPEQDQETTSDDSGGTDSERAPDPDSSEAANAEDTDAT